MKKSSSVQGAAADEQQRADEQLQMSSVQEAAADEQEHEESRAAGNAMRLQMAATIEMVQWCRGDAAMHRNCGGGATGKRESGEQLQWVAIATQVD